MFLVTRKNNQIGTASLLEMLTATEQYTRHEIPKPVTFMDPMFSRIRMTEFKLLCTTLHILKCVPFPSLYGKVLQKQSYQMHDA